MRIKRVFLGKAIQLGENKQSTTVLSKERVELRIVSMDLLGDSVDVVADDFEEGLPCRRHFRIMAPNIAAIEFHVEAVSAAASAAASAASKSK